MSHVLDIRKKTAQERLRGDHIDLLYQLEGAKSLNENYEKEIDRLKKIIVKCDLPMEKVVEKEDESKEVLEMHLTTIAQLQNEVSELSNEIKTIKAKESLTEKSHQRKVEALEGQLLDSKKNFENLQLLLHESKCEKGRIASSYDDRIKDLEDTIAHLERRSDLNEATERELYKNKYLALEKEALESKRIIEQNADDMQKKDEEFSAELAKQEETVEELNNIILHLEKKIVRLSSENKSAHQVIDNLRAKLTEIDLATPEVVLVHDNVDGAHSTVTIGKFELFSPTYSCAACYVRCRSTADSSTQTDSMLDKNKDKETGNHFKDYVSLKKENMTLKLQLAHKESTGRRGSGSSGDGQTNPLLLDTRNRPSVVSHQHKKY